MAEGDDVQRVWDAQMFSHTVRCVCADCNNGWMSELEDEVKPVLTPLLKNHRTTLTRDDQILLATWATKTGLVHQGRDRVTRMPAKHFRYVYGHGHIVFQIFGHGIRNVVGLRPKNWKERYVSVIWPDIEAPLPWPPFDQLTDEELQRFGAEV
jgi:hypothetical protein